MYKKMRTTYENLRNPCNSSLRSKSCESSKKAFTKSMVRAFSKVGMRGLLT